MAVEAVIFDWGGTLTPWRTLDYRAEWRSLAAAAAPDDVDAATDALLAAATRVWAAARDSHTSATFADICAAAGLAVTDEHALAYRAFWEHATWTDPDARPLLEALRTDGLRIGVLSNTVWPRSWHEEIFARDGILELLDAGVYTSEIAWTKPHERAFAAARRAVGVSDPSRCVFVGDRLFDDIWGARNAGMRTIWLPHSDIPADQIGHSIGEPDAVIDRLGDVRVVVESWQRSSAEQV